MGTCSGEFSGWIVTTGEIDSDLWGEGRQAPDGPILGILGHPRTSEVLKTFLGKGELGGTGWEGDCALSLRSEDFEPHGFGRLPWPSFRQLDIW